MNAAYLKRCVDEERRAKIAAGFTMYATTRSPTTAHHPPIASPPFPIPRFASKNSLTFPNDPRPQHSDGMNMKDASTGEVLWEINSWPVDWHVAEVEARVPARILACPAVSRELTFSSKEKVANLRCEHGMYLDGVETPIEVWDFSFGFVMPGSRNTWQTTVEAAGGERMLKPSEVSGKLTVRTKFTDGDVVVHESVVRVFYE
jgi:retinal rod rhodopsin-sensitive cGMP 3',5'-cyclic phosphodiesterase subunit delta